MPDPQEEQRRKTEFDPERLDEHGKIVHEALSSKRVEEPGQQSEETEETRAGQPRSARSGSDSNASRRTRGG